VEDQVLRPITGGENPLVEDYDLASMQMAMASNSRKLASSQGGDPPGDMMKKLSLSGEDGDPNFNMPSMAAVNAVNGRSNASASGVGAVANNSLEVQLPSPRSQVISGGAGSGAGSNHEASKALQSMQSSAVATENKVSNNKKKSHRGANSHDLSDRRDRDRPQEGDQAVEDGEEFVEEEEEEEESSEASASDEDGSWISWFCSLRGNEFFCEVDEDYIQDDFNLTGLNVLVPYYDYALDMVLDVEMPLEDSLTEEQQEIVESAAEMLYGLIHARYIVTNRGMHAMYEKYRTAAFGRCPHVFCQGQPVLPVGLSDLPRNYTVNVFCPRCHSLYFPKSTRQANIDGAYFGTTFPHLYLITHPDMVPAKPTQTYAPRVYGFKVNSQSLYYLNREESQQQQQQIESTQRQNRRSRHRYGRK